MATPSSDASTIGSDPLADVLQWLEQETVREEDEVAQDMIMMAADQNAPGNDVDGVDEGSTNSRASDDDACMDDLSVGNTGEETHPRAQLPKGSSFGQADGKAITRPGRILHPTSPPARGECAGNNVTCSASSMKGGCLSDGKGPSIDTSVEDEEDKEWEHRRQRTGTVGRLVRYNAGTNPREDVTLRGGNGRHVVVAKVRDGGQAGRCGIRAGDRLVSIDGSKEFQSLSANAISEKLQAPSVLVFVGFIGQLQAEVRLNVTEESLGISNRQDVLTGSYTTPLQLCEERVFNTGTAPLFLSIGSFQEEARPFFELRRAEAYRLLGRALSRDDVQNLIENRENGITVDGVTTSNSLVEAKPAMPPLNLHRLSKNDAKGSESSEAHEV